MKRMSFGFWIAGVFLLRASTVLADSPADLQAMRAALESMKAEMTRMHDTVERQNLRIQQLESRQVLETPKPSVPIQPVVSAPEAIPWMQGLKFGGDFRLRAESLDYYDKNNDAGSTGAAADRSRNRFRMRLRWGFEKDFGDDWKTGFRLATGSTTDPTSTNQTLGNPGYFNLKTISIDRAYAVYEPGLLKDKGPVKAFRVGAGKFENPFFRYSTPMLWDPDVTPEGVYEQGSFRVAESDEAKIRLDAVAGQFIVNESAAVESDAAIFGYQGALTVSTRVFGTKQPVDFAAAVSYYDYTNWFQTVTGNTAGVSYLRTNSIVADDFRVLDVYPEVVFTVHQLPVTLWYDWAKNLANVGTEDAAQSGGNDIHDSDQGWGFGAKLGKAKKKGSWEVSYSYYEIQANSVVAAFNDGDFGGPGTSGFSNRQGHKVGFVTQLTDSVSVSWYGYVVRPLQPSTAVGSSSNESVFRSQAELLYKF